MQPAARLIDMHTCPMTTGPVPHVGGPISGPSTPTVLIGGMPVACVGDMAVCVGPPDVIAREIRGGNKGSETYTGWRVKNVSDPFDPLTPLTPFESDPFVVIPASNTRREIASKHKTEIGLVESFKAKQHRKSGLTPLS